jgi:hypothetical protein
MDDDTRQCLLQLAKAVQSLAGAHSGGGQNSAVPSSDAGLIVQGVIDQLGGPGSRSDQKVRAASTADPNGGGLGGANTGGGE